MNYLIKFIFFLFVCSNLFANENKKNEILFKINNKVFTDIDLEITPESGMLISFPPWLRHAVPPLEKNDQRVIIAANWLMKKGGQPETPN